MDRCRKSSNKFVDQPLQSKIVVETSRSSFGVSKQLSRSVMLNGSGKNGTTGNRRVPFITYIGNLKTNRREMAHGHSGVVRAVWHGELLMTRGRMLRTRYAERGTMKQHLAASPTVWSIVRRNSLTAEEERKTEMWRKTGTLSVILRI
jgi:hypothetical protein